LERAEPFLPFVLHLADGRRYPVATAECIAISPDGRTVGIFGEGDSFKLLHAGQITDAEPEPAARPATRS
jgi:hypothetical protein